MVRIIALLAILVSTYSFGQFTDVRQIPDPKSSGSTKNSSNDSSESIRDYVSNPDYIISSEDELAINKMRNQLRKKYLQNIEKGEGKIQTGMIYNNLIHSLEKVGDHIYNR